MKLRKIEIFLFFIFIGFDSICQEKIEFKHIGVNEGLSQRWVKCVFQDSYDFMWFGTKDGLNRFDGYDFTIYRPDRSDPFSIHNSEINSIVEVPNGDLWIATFDGIAIYRREKDQFERFSELPGESVSRLILVEGGVWIGTFNGLHYYDLRKNELISYFSEPDNPSSLSDNDIRALYLDSTGKLWVGTSKGVNTISYPRGSVQRVDLVENEIRLGEYMYNALGEDDLGRIFIGSWQKGLIILDPNKPKGMQLAQVVEKSVISLLIDDDRRIWIGFGAGNGLMYGELKEILNGRGVVFKHEPHNPKSLSNNTTYCIFQDKWGDVWIGTYGDGLNYYSKRAKKFGYTKLTVVSPQAKSDLVNRFNEDDKFFWVGTENGLSRRTKKTGTYKHYEHNENDPYSLGANPIYELTIDSKENLWIGAWNGGLTRYDYKNDRFYSYKNRKGDPRALGINHVFAIEEDDKSNLWIGMIGAGLDYFDRSDITFSHYKWHDSNPDGISSHSVNDVLWDSKGRLWVLTVISLDLFDFEKQRFIHHIHDPVDSTSIAKGHLEVVFEDSKAGIWVGLEGGLNYYDEENDQFIKYTVQDGLPNNYIQSILEDDAGNLWMGTNYGISKFENGIERPEKPKFINYTVNDGLQGNVFIKRSSFKDNRGKMYFGGTNGYTEFYPNQIRNNTVLPTVHLVDLHVDGKKTYPGGEESILPREIYLEDEITLSYENSVFSIGYTALNYLNSQKNQYAFMLEGFDSDWQYVGDLRRATYTNIDPGLYTFKVKASNNDGYWNEDYTSILVTVVPPWWQTWWFRIGAFFSLVLIILGFMRYRTASLKKNQLILEHKVKIRTQRIEHLNGELSSSNRELVELNAMLIDQKEELQTALDELKEAKGRLAVSEKMASLGVFTAGIAHEINNPINFIAGAAQKLADIVEKKRKMEKDSKEVGIFKELIKLMNVGVERTTQIVKSLGNYTRNHPGQYEEYNIVNCAEDALVILSHKIEKADIEVVRDFPEEVKFYCLPGRISQIFVNLITNAIDAVAQKDGEISVKISKVKNDVLLEVSDNGSGIKESEKSKLFDPFFSTKEVGKGTGLGLYIVFGIVEEHHGTIDVLSNNPGTRFVIELPVRKMDQEMVEKEKEILSDSKG